MLFNISYKNPLHNRLSIRRRSNEVTTNEPDGRRARKNWNKTCKKMFLCDEWRVIVIGADVHAERRDLNKQISSAVM